MPGTFTYNIPAARAKRSCSKYDVAATAKYLWRRDRTRARRKTGTFTWTRSDSRRIRINHDKLYRAYRLLVKRHRQCGSGTYPHCSYLGQSSWFQDQSERIKAILSKRRPRLARWNFTKRAYNNLKRMGIGVTSPYVISAKTIGRKNIRYKRVRSAKAITLKKGSTTLLSIRLNKADFVSIHAVKDGLGALEFVGILVSHKSGKLSYYEVAGGSIIHREIKVDKVKGRRTVRVREVNTGCDPFEGGCGGVRRGRDRDPFDGKSVLP